MGTDENLKEAFAGESQANRRYMAFAKKADEEGMANVAKLFRAVAEAETVHAHSHLKLMNVTKSTKENLQTAIDGERYENTEMYPKFIEVAKKEERSDADRTFSWANSVEKIHQAMYEKAIESANQGKDIDSKEYYICQTCGNTVGGEAPEKCPICGMPREQFKKAE